MTTHRHLHTHGHTYTPPHCDTNTCMRPHHPHNTCTHTRAPPLPHTNRADEKAAAAGSPVSHTLCSPPTPPPPPPILISESQVKTAQKRCILRLDLKDMRDVENQVCIGTEFHTQGAWYRKALKPVLFKLTRGAESSLSEDDQRDLWGVYKVRQCEM